MKRILITGGTGFVGANLARRCLEDGHEVHLVVRAGYKDWRIRDIQPHIRLWEARLDDPQAMENCVAGIHPDWVMHLAVYGAYPFQQDVHQMVMTSFVGTVNLVNACIRSGVEAFVNTGSSSEYGLKDHAPSEDERIEPNSLYAINKAAGTHYCQYAAQRYRFPATTLRLYSVYGPFEEPTRLIPTMIVQGLKGRYPPLVSPQIARDYTFTSDVVNSYLLAAKQAGQTSGQIYNIGTGRQTTLEEVARVVGVLLPIAEEPRWGTLAPRDWDTATWVSNPEKACKNLGWKARYSLQEGIQETLQWFIDHPAHRMFYEEQLLLG